jgi:hypothetical protein
VYGTSCHIVEVTFEVAVEKDDGIGNIREVVECDSPATKVGFGVELTAEQPLTVQLENDVEARSVSL